MEGMTRREFRDLASPEEARTAIASLDITPGDTAVPLEEAIGRTLARRIDAPVDVPGFNRAAMDGYAVRASDTFGASEGNPIEFSVTGAVQAGEKPTASADTDEAVQVATGAVLPPGTNAVVPVERTVEHEDVVAVTTAVAPGDSVMPRGADVAAGDRSLGPSTRLGPRHIGLLAALGRETVPIKQRPRVAVVSTGEELIQPGESLRSEAGQIFDVNGYSIAAAVEVAGGAPARYTSASDDLPDVEAVLERAAENSELLLTSGSTSAGEVDVLPDLLEEHGEILVHGVALKPGRPLLVGRVYDTPYVGLPGYPVSALTVFRTLVAPHLRSAAGLREPADATVTATLATRVRYDGGRLRLVPVGVTGDGAGSLVAYTLSRGSGATTSLVEADGVVTMSAETNLLSAGEEVTVEQFDADDPLPSLLTVGEPDPLVSVLLDELDAPRHLALAPRDAIRWLGDGIPDVVVTALDVADAAASDVPDPLVTFDREWGLVVRSGDPGGITGMHDIQARDVRFVNLDADLAVRHAFDALLATNGEGDPADDIDGYEHGLPGLESAARSVADGHADCGLALRTTAETLGLEFVSLGRQRLGLVPNPDRQGKPGFERFAAVLDERLDDLLEATLGYEP